MVSTKGKSSSEEELGAQRLALRRITELAENVRDAYNAMHEIMRERDRAIVEAIDVHGVSHRQAARAALLSLPRIEGILAND